ncbi:MAG TPA: hypothetical protein VGI03_08155 [Verrucomicrobiae bacterium]|jgi:Tfp pilus assembly protein PilO
MKKFFAQLRPMERRLAVAVLVIVILVLNWWFIWPHFADWGNYHGQLVGGQQTLALYQKTIADSAKYDALVKDFENQGEFVPAADQAISFLRTVQSQSSASGAGISGMGHVNTHTNEFFVEQTQSIDVNGNDQQLVDFLYKLGSSASMIRVLDLELQPDQSRMKLNAHVELMASYLKNPTAAPTAAAETSKVKAPVKEPQKAPLKLPVKKTAAGPIPFHKPQQP